MGNSGSVHNLATLDDHHHQQHRFQHQYHTASNPHHSPSVRQSGLPLPPNQWSQSIPRTQRAAPSLTAAPIKVLPTLAAGSNGLRLRATNNGDILHGGGTISGRRESTVHRLVTTPPPQPNRPPPPMQRAQTQLNMVGRRTTPLQAFQKLQHTQAAAAEATPISFKRFDSEPDLRETINTNKPSEKRSPPTNAPPSRSMAAVRKKLAPPPPLPKTTTPPSRPTYDPSRFGWKPPPSTTIQKQSELPTTSMPRKLRLFKTKAESRTTKTTAKPTEPTPNPSSPQPPKFRREKSFDISLLLLNQRHKEAAPPPPLNATSHNKADDFQRELLAATATRRQSTVVTSTVVETVLPPIPRVRHLPGSGTPTTTPPPPPPPPPPPLTSVVHRPSQSTPLDAHQPLEVVLDPASSKTFYFGMEETSAAPNAIEDVHLIDEYLTNKIQMDVIDRFAESLLHKQNRRQRRKHNRRHGRDASAGSSSASSSSSFSANSSSAASSSSSMANDNQDCGEADYDPMSNIYVQMRPTLPRRQLEIPRFSPAAAWKTLLANSSSEIVVDDQPRLVANQFSSYTAGEDGEDGEEVEEQRLPLESRIERIYREPLGAGDGAAAFADTTKSGDSGISGDAGEEGGQPLAMTAAPAVGPFPAAWTPQLDLGEDEEEEEDDDDDDDEEDLRKKPNAMPYSPRGGHIFSLSLPRDPHMVNKLGVSEFGGFNSLQKMRSNHESDPKNPDTNWSLGRSAPTSLDIFTDPKLSAPTAATPTPVLTASRRPRQQQPSFGYLGGCGAPHVMYLPNQIPVESPRKYSTDSVDTTAPSTEPTKKPRTSSHHHRFTFQSTIRQIERRRLAERLSRDAEQMEAHRVSEAEAMRRVEEEFQRKRANEKATIRQQLRLYTQLQNGSGGGGGGDSGGHRSLPFEWQQSTMAPRADPEGAVASPGGSPRSPPKFSRRNQNSKDTNNNQTNDHQETISTSSSRSSSSDRKANSNRLADEAEEEEEEDVYDDDRCSSNESYGPPDTKTPYIMRLIEAKSGNRLRQPPSTEILSEFRNSQARREYVDYRGMATNHHPPKVVSRIPNITSSSSSPSDANRQVKASDHHLHHPDHHTNYRREFAHGRSVCSSDSEISASGLGKPSEMRLNNNRAAQSPSSGDRSAGIVAKALPARAR